MKKKASEKGTFEDGPFFFKKNGREVNADQREDEPPGMAAEVNVDGG